MKQFISTLCLLLFACSLSAQQVPLRGVVTVQNSRVNTGKTVYVPGVEVKHEKANPTLTDNEGKFALKVIGIPTGNQITLSALPTGKFKGYVVVNERDLSNITLGRTEPVGIFVCNKEELEKQKAEMIGINLRKYEQRTNEQLNRLKKERDAALMQYNISEGRLRVIKDSIRFYQDNLDNAIERIQKYADDFVRTNLDNRDVNFIKAYNCFHAGDLDSVDFYLPETEILRKYQQGNALQKVTDKLTKEATEAMDIKINTALLRNDFEEVNRLFVLTLGYDKENHIPAIQYANFLLTENQFTQAEKYLERGITKVLSKLSDDENNSFLRLDYAIALNYYGNLLRYQRLYARAEVYYSKSLDQFELLNAKASENISIKTNYAWLLSNFGNNCRFLKKFDQANLYHEACLDIREKLYELNPELYQADYAKILHNLGSSLRDQNKMENVMTYYKKSLTIWENKGNLVEQAHVVSSIAKFYFVKFEYEQAVPYYNRAVELRIELTQTNPLANEPKLAYTYNWSAINDYYKKNYDEALLKFTESNKILYNLLHDEPKAFIPYLFENLNFLLRIYLQKDKQEEVKKIIDETKVLYQNNLTKINLLDKKELEKIHLSASTAFLLNGDNTEVEKLLALCNQYDYQRIFQLSVIDAVRNNSDNAKNEIRKIKKNFKSNDIDVELCHDFINQLKYIRDNFYNDKRIINDLVRILE